MAQSWPRLMDVPYHMQVGLIVPTFHAGTTDTGLDVETVSKDRFEAHAWEKILIRRKIQGRMEEFGKRFKVWDFSNVGRSFYTSCVLTHDQKKADLQSSFLRRTGLQSLRSERESSKGTKNCPCRFLKRSDCGVGLFASLDTIVLRVMADCGIMCLQKKRIPRLMAFEVPRERASKITTLSLRLDPSHLYLVRDLSLFACDAELHRSCLYSRAIPSFP